MDLGTPPVKKGILKTIGSFLLKTPVLVTTTLISMASVGTLIILQPFTPDLPSGPDYDLTEPPGPSNAVIGVPDNITQKELEEDLNRKVQEGIIAFACNKYVMFKEGWNEVGDLLLISPRTNTNFIEFVIRRDDTGEIIYRSGLMPPDSYIKEDRLQSDKVMRKGVYNCTATVSMYHRDDKSYLGRVQTEVIITLEK